MSDKKEFFKNTFTFIFSQIFTICFRFISKPIMLKSIGEEMLGIGGAIGSILTTLSLAELGFHAAIIYHLYKPLAENDYDTCNEYMNVLSFFYRIIAIFITTFTIIIFPFLKFLIKGVEINLYISCIYFLTGFTSAFGYLFADKLQLLFADKKDYIAKRIDVSFSFFLMILELVVVFYTRNYLIYCIMVSCRCLIINIVTAFITHKHYNWLKKRKVKKEYVKQILHDIKNLSIANFAGFVYFNTDNIVISSFLGAVSVTYFGNYTGITSALRNVADLGIRQVEPFLGHIYAEDNSTERNYPLFLMNTFVRFIISGMLIIPSFVLMNNFITWWIGEKYILSNFFLILLCSDFYLFIVHRALSDYIAITGSYNYERNISLIGAFVNLSTSIILVHFIGLEGILLGTVISEIVFWIGRSYIVFYKIFKVDVKSIFIYIVKNICYIAIVLLTVTITVFINHLFELNSFIIDFILKGVIIELIFLLFVILFFSKAQEFNKLIYFIKKRKN